MKKIIFYKMEKAYVLVGSSGSWDDHTKFIIGIYSSEEAANEAGDNFLVKRKETLEQIEKSCPVSDEILKGIENYDFDPEEKLTSAQAEKYHEWWWAKHNVTNINDSYNVEEHTLNQALEFFGDYQRVVD
jgi:hypothetical protein